MDILLIVVLLILAGFGLHGYLRGLVRVLFSLVAVFLTIVLATAITPYVAHFLQTQTPLYDTVKEKCVDYLQSAVEDGMQQETQGQEMSMVFGIKMPEELQKLFTEPAVGPGGLIENTGVYEKAGDFVAAQVVQRLAWVFSFVLILALLSVVVHFLDILAKLPVLKNINRIGGLAVGLLEGLIVVWILFLAVFLCQGTEFGREMMDTIQGNAFLRLINDNNVLEHMIMGPMQ